MKSMLFIFFTLFITAGTSIALPSSGYYNLNDIVLRHAPSAKQNGSAWDPMGGAPDIFLEIFIEDSYGVLTRQSSTSAKDNCGTSAIWSSPASIFIDARDIDDSDLKLVIKVWDEDMTNHDFIDAGSLLISEIEPGDVEMELSFGTTVSFTVVGPLVE